MSRYTEIKGCIHIHFPLRKLGKKIERLGREGEKAGVDFIIINSHTPEKNPKKYERTFKKEGYYGKTLIITAEETDDKKRQNHLLVIGEKNWYGNKDNVKDVLAAIDKNTTISFVAHPDGYHKLFLIKKQHLWTDRDIDGFTGIEIWSMLFDWAENTRIYNLPVRYFGFPQNLKGPKKNVLDIWDALSLKRKIVGIAGLDIHSLPFLFYLLDINKSFRYYSIFKGLRNHLLLKEPMTGSSEKDKANITNTLKKGSLFFANDLIADSSGFFFGTEDGEKTMGDTVSMGTTLFVRNPLKANTRIIYNGTPIIEELLETKKFIPEKEGIYRIEVEHKGKKWIFSNHIRVE
ncbi:MAG: hypothetical protein NC905_02820 [Candidatus Omnitrophica bacterium]|nr:hypothetical protein [Candidatus Omnitrophota bacterium]MCM8777182.1 hypothetical protein [Candidatus Omnitrophota bacterium]